MQAKIEIVPAQSCHVRTIARRMRQADKDEVYAFSRHSPRVALKYSLDKSSLAMTALVNGRPEAMWGAAEVNILNGIAAPWLLGTDAILMHQRAFLRYSVEWRRKLCERYTVLRNFVDERNTVSIRWLQWLGFKLLDPLEVNGQSFRLFELRSDDVRNCDGGTNAGVRCPGRSGADAAGTGHGAV